MEYEMLTKGCSRAQKGSLKITDGPGNSFVVPKEFCNLKPIDSENGKGLLVFCNKGGKTLFDCKKYNEVDDRFKSINIETIDKDKIDLEELRDEGFIFSIKSSKANSKSPAIFNINDNVEMGILSDLTLTGKQNNKREIFVHNDGDGRGHVTLFDIIQQSAPDAFDKNGKFKYLDKITNLDIKMSVSFKNTGLYDCRDETTSDYNYPKSCFKVYKKGCGSNGYDSFEIDSEKNSRCNLKELLTNEASNMNIYFDEIPETDGKPILFLHVDSPLRAYEHGTLIFKSSSDFSRKDVPVYLEDHTHEGHTHGDYMYGDYMF